MEFPQEGALGFLSSCQCQKNGLTLGVQDEKPIVLAVRHVRVATDNGIKY